MSPAFVFVVLATGISEHTLVTEVRGVFAHMHQTTRLVRQIKADGQQALVTKHTVEGLTDEPAMQTSWLPGGQPIIIDSERAIRDCYVVMAGSPRQAVAVYKDRNVAQEHVEQLWRQGDDRAFVATEPVRQAVEPRVQARIDAYYNQEEDALIKRDEDRAYGDR